MNNSGNTEFTIHILPRQTMTWEEFLCQTPPGSIALDGMVNEGPRFDEASLHINFDHHCGVVREATMSTASQVYMALKGGLMESFGKCPICNIYINDTDQDVAIAIWLLKNHHLFTGTKSIPHINRLIALDNNWDITGGAFPVNLSEELVCQHNWVFKPYVLLRTSGQLAQASEEMLRDNLESIHHRLNKFLMGEAEKTVMDTRHEILFQSETFWIVDEMGGNEARYYLFSQGMNAFISRVATRPDDRYVYTVGRRSRFIPFPVTKLYKAFNEAEGISSGDAWGGSDIIGGSPRGLGSSLSWEQLRDITTSILKKERGDI